MKWILTFTLLTFMSLVLAEDYSCPDGKSKKSITIKKDESFNFDIAPGYGSKTRCGVTYKPQRRGKTKCTKIKFSCTTFDLPNKSGPPKCKKGDKLKVGKQFFCKTKSPEVESTKPIKLMFLSDKKDSSGAATCTIMCADTATAPPPTTTTGPGSGSGDCKCGLAKRVSRIVGGQEAEVNEYPWQAGLVSTGSTKPWCGGSLVNSKWVLTAAHCTAGENANSIQILLGDHKTNKNDHVVFNVASINDHQSYDSQTTDYDFSMIKLTTAVDWAAHPDIRPVCLPATTGNDYSGVTATVTGWGTTSSGGSQSKTLLEVDVGVISNNQCSNDYGYSSSWITDTMLCAVVPGGGKDACQGDSGGPLVATSGDGVTPGQNYDLIGVVSWGIGCASADYPGVYARVTNQLSWIQNWMATDGEDCPRA